MARSSNIVLSEEEQEAVRDALEELNVQLVRYHYQCLKNGVEHVEDERHQASKVMSAMRKLSRVPADIQAQAYYQRKLQVNSLLKELSLDIDSGENLGLKKKVKTPAEEAWKTALDELNKQLVLYDRVGRLPEQVLRQTSEEEQAAKVVAAMHKVSVTHTDPKVKEEFLRKAENFMKASPEERRKGSNELLKGLLKLIATSFALAAVGSAASIASLLMTGA
ncbi:hypothetical protein C0992_000413 [Termitomyces sp. T32_za158]|nr:hypothetical protein C0992_000413 [Termitomyces sp. T32_za158]